MELRRLLSLKSTQESAQKSNKGSEPPYPRSRWPLLIALVIGALIACDIQPVAVGTWQVKIGDGQDPRQEIWTISGAGQITLARDSGNITTAVELAGSRVSWTTGSMEPTASDRVNFSGTVNGNELSGTLFSQQGNHTVTGTRR